MMIESTSVGGKSRARLFMRQLIPFVVTTIVVKSAQESSCSTGASSNFTGASASAGAGGAARKEDKVGMQVIEEGIQTLKSLATSSSEDARKWIVCI